VPTRSGRSCALDLASAGRPDGELEYIDSVSHETVRQALAADALKPWQEEEWCIPPEQSGEFVCHMEDVLEVYTLPEDPSTRWCVWMN